MSVIFPSPRAFFRFILGSLFGLSALATGGLLNRANQLEVDLSSSRAWQVALLFLFLLSLLGLIGLILIHRRVKDASTDWLEQPLKGKKAAPLFGALFLIASMVGFSILMLIPYVRQIIGNDFGLRACLFWMLSLVGMWGIKLLRKHIHWLTALLAAVLLQATLYLILVYLSGITDYPFSMGWSETSYFYYPSLFLSQQLYGRALAWPVLHPTLHLLLTPPYLFGAPLWFHRLWQVLLRFLFIGLIAPALIARLKITDRALRALFAIWVFLFLFIGPLYLHLAVPIILLLWGFSRQNDRRTWIILILASIWAGWSRINWFPVPGMLAAILYFLEEPVSGRKLWSYLLKPAVFFIAGTLAAFGAQRLYIALSGYPAAYFYTSLKADLLWYRLLPNSTYPLGVLPAVLLVSMPLFVTVYLALRKSRSQWHPVRLFFLLAAWLVLFVGGLVVSARIGGGGDLHNMDAYLVLALILFSYLVFAQYRTETRSESKPASLHWALAIWIAITPLWFLLPHNVGVVNYDKSRTDAILQELQHNVDEANAAGGEILFISQRHLFSLGMLDDMEHVREYEREELMEMAQGEILDYLLAFRNDMQTQRFALIVVDQLKDNIFGRFYPFSEENNIWVRRVVRPILCNYREEVVFSEDKIALYVPQEGERHCP